MGRNRDQRRSPAWVTGAASAAAAVILVVVSVASADEHDGLVVALGVGALVALAGGLVTTSPIAVFGAVALLGAEAALADAPAPPLVALGLFAVAELAYWSLDERFARVEDRGVHRERLVLLGIISTAALFIGAAIRLVARDEAERGSSYTVVAAVSIVALVILVVARARVAQRTTTGT